MLTQIGLQHYLVLGAILFAAGVALIVVRRNAVMVLMGLELVMNAAGINFVAFSRFVPAPEKSVRALSSAPHLWGDATTIFIIILAAAEAAVALAIVLNIFHNFNTVEVDQVDQLRE